MLALNGTFHPIISYPDGFNLNATYISFSVTGIVKLNREDELELVLPDRLQNLISVDEDSTFFGVIQLN